MRLRATRLTAIATSVQTLLSRALLKLNFTSGTLDPRVTFSRTSNATLTNSAGLVAYAPHNLLTYSEQFDNSAWNKGSTITVVANTASAPDGTLSADTITASFANSYIYQVFSASAATYTFSVWIKSVSAGTSLELNLYTNTGASSVGAAVVTTTGSWQRVSVTGVFASASASAWATIGGNASFSTGETIYVWGAQLELGSTATTYNPTTVKNLLGYTEHFDNAAWTKSNAFVQTNLLTYSQDFDNAAWTKSSTTVTANAIAAPDGTLTADLITGGGNWFGQVSSSAGIPNQQLTGSIWVYPPAGVTSLTIRIDRANIAQNNQTVKTVIPETWQRVTHTATLDAGVNAPVLRVDLTGGTALYVWGAQLVQGTSAGDYKATYAAAAAVGYSDIYGQPFAQKLVEDTATNAHFLFQSLTTSGTYTASLYAKSAERSTVAIRFYITTANWVTAVFDLATGVVSQSSAGASSTFSGVSASIQSVGNGWYRCALTATGTSVINTVISTTSSATPTLLANGGVESYTGNGTSGIYIFGAQLSDSASVDPYVYNPVAAPTAQAYYGPRFDYDPVTLVPKGLLIEEQRTNLLTYSEQFDNVAWTKSSATATANAVISPDGVVDADKVIASAGSAQHYILQNVSIAANATYTTSFYAKSAEYTSFDVWLLNATTADRAVANFNLASGTTTNVTAGGTPFTGQSSTITPVGNGWYRCTLTATTTGGAINLQSRLFPKDSTTYTGDGTSGIYIWGAQLEAGSQASSYIPTVASQVTRAADSASMIGNNFARWFNVNEGSMYAEYLPTQISNTPTIYGHSTSDTSGPSLGSGASFQHWNGSTVLGPTANSGGLNTTGKSVLAYTGTASRAICLNAGTVATSATTVGVFNTIRLGATATVSPAQFLNGTIKRIAYFNHRLSNTELQGITS